MFTFETFAIIVIVSIMAVPISMFVAAFIRTPLKKDIAPSREELESLIESAYTSDMALGVKEMLRFMRTAEFLEEKLAWTVNRIFTAPELIVKQIGTIGERLPAEEEVIKKFRGFAERTAEEAEVEITDSDIKAANRAYGEWKESIKELESRPDMEVGFIKDSVQKLIKKHFTRNIDLSDMQVAAACYLMLHNAFTVRVDNIAKDGLAALEARMKKAA